MQIQRVYVCSQKQHYKTRYSFKKGASPHAPYPVGLQFASGRSAVYFMHTQVRRHVRNFITLSQEPYNIFYHHYTYVSTVFIKLVLCIGV